MPYIPTHADEQGKANWEPYDTLTAGNLNHIEDGIADATQKAEEKELPSSGSVGQVLTKKEDGVEWKETAVYWTIDGGGNDPSWNSPLAKAAANWNEPESAILDWEID